MLSDICAECKNYFIKNNSDIHTGVYSITNHSIEALPFLANGQYFRIVGSALNDGVYKYGAAALNDETFDGAIWSMYVPADFVALSDDVDAWKAANAEATASPYQSESFGGYSYSKSMGATGGAWTWRDQFSARLNKYRRLFVI